MSVGVLLVTHDKIGTALIEAARHVLTQLPLHVESVEIGADTDPEAALLDTANLGRQLEQSDGVLVLTDLFGATPCNVALRLHKAGLNTRCVSGLNLPMLLRVLNYAEQPLPELAEIAVRGGRDGVRGNL